MFFQKPSSVEFLIVGLGNPGAKYAGTRHNAGFDALDWAARRWGIRVDRARFDALTGTGEAAGHKVLLLKPQTFMNLSGQAVGKAAAFYKVPAQNVIVLFDDISLAPVSYTHLDVYKRQQFGCPIFAANQQSGCISTLEHTV